MTENTLFHLLVVHAKYYSYVASQATFLDSSFGFAGLAPKMHTLVGNSSFQHTACIKRTSKQRQVQSQVSPSPSFSVIAAMLANREQSTKIKY